MRKESQSEKYRRAKKISKGLLRYHMKNKGLKDKEDGKSSERGHKGNESDKVHDKDDRYQD